MTEPFAFQDALDRYIEICERALASDKTTGPMRAIFRSALDQLNGERLSLALYDDQPKALCHVDILDQKVCTSEAIVFSEPANSEAYCPSSRVVRLSLTHIQDVIAQPERYLENPALLDWSWLSPASSKFNQ